MTETAFRSKRVCLSYADWIAFGGGLAEAFPAARYYPIYVDSFYETDEPPALPVESSLAAFFRDPNPQHYQINMAVAPAWTLRWNRGEHRWYVREFCPFVRIRPGGRVIDDKPDAPPHIRSGEIDVCCEAGNKEHFAFARRFYRVFRKFASNTDQIGLRYPGYEVLWSIDKGSITWLGHDAIRWARENKRRMLYYDHRGWGYRPNDEGIVKPE